MTNITIKHDRFRIRGGFTIARGSRTHADAVTVTVSDGIAVGRGECTPYARYGESVESVSQILEALRTDLESGALDRKGLQARLPSGAARNALDCALWDLEAKRAGTSVAKLAGVNAPRATTTAYTLSLDTPRAMAKAAYDNRHRPLLKVKLGGDGDLERMRAVCSHAGDATVIVDANEAWPHDRVWDWLEEAKRLGIALVEQPLPAGQDDCLADRPHPVPICADESAHDSATLDAIAGTYDVVNIKLDKTGGLTEALALKKAAQAQGLGVFIGCMMGSSLAMAPAMLLVENADYVDLDAPLLLDEDRPHALTFDGSTLHPPSPALWG